MYGESNIHSTVSSGGSSILIHPQLCGRGGTPSRAHLLFNAKGKVKDPTLTTYCSKTPGCRRSTMLRGLGSDEEAVANNSDATTCCDVCCVSCPYDRLDILKPVRRKNQKRPAAVRDMGEDLSKQLRAKLCEEQDAVLIRSLCTK